MKKRFSIRYKLIIIFGLLVALASFIEGVLAVRTARKAVVEKIEAHLIDKATDTAEVIDGKVTAFFQFFEGIARTPILRDPTLSYQEKTAYLVKEAAFNPRIHKMNLCDMHGIRYAENGQQIDVSDREYFRAASQGKNFVAEPVISRLDGDLILVFTVPVYDDNRAIINVLLATVEASILSHDIHDIVVGQTGYCSINGRDGTVIADPDEKVIQDQENPIVLAKSDQAFSRIGTFIEQALRGKQAPAVV